MGGDNDHVIPAIVAGINHHAIACTSRRGSTLALSGVRFHRSCGNWLAEAGFSTDTPVMVSVEQEQL
ncbi:type I toxin-antitoxin system SymE family toxin [Klebsiella variicola subsp. variicola]|nr:type I toxin-antitoxin system SymE family toxin [Klebsiella variicola subsp. variicola]